MARERREKKAQRVALARIAFFFLIFVALAALLLMAGQLDYVATQQLGY